MSLYVRFLSADEIRQLEDLQRRNAGLEIARRTRIILLSSAGRGVHEISRTVGLHPINARKWIHRFNEQGMKGLYPRRSPGRPRIFDERQRQAILKLASTEPGTLGLGFPSWSLQRLRAQLIQRGVMRGISAETIRQELLRGGLVFTGSRWASPMR